MAITNANIILLDIPHRYDLEETSCVNKEILVFNRKLKKITKVYKHVILLESSTNRKAYTRHGMHLNRLGKRQIARQIVSIIMGVTEKKVDSPISLNWELDVSRTCVSPMEHVAGKAGVEENVEDYIVEGQKNESDKRVIDDHQQNEADDTGDLSNRGIVEDMDVDTLFRSKRIRRIPATRTADFLW